MDRRVLLFFLVSFGGIFLLSALKNAIFPPPVFILCLLEPGLNRQVA